MLTWGMELSLPITKTQIDGTAIYNVADGALIACFADEISESVLCQIAKAEPLRAVLRTNPLPTPQPKSTWAKSSKKKHQIPK